MPRKKGLTVKEVFSAMKQCDDNVKEASQLLQVKKTSIYNIKSRNKEEWARLEAEHTKGEDDVQHPFKERSVARPADYKIDKSNRGVKSEMAEKFTGKSFPISDPAPAKAPEKKMDDNLTIAKLQKENATIRKSNTDIDAALKRANKDKEELAIKHNQLVNDFNDVQALSKERREKIEERDARIAELEAELEKQPQQPAELAYTSTGFHLVKLGKMYVTEDFRLRHQLKNAICEDADKALKIAEATGGSAQEVVLIDRVVE